MAIMNRFISAVQATSAPKTANAKIHVTISHSVQLYDIVIALIATMPTKYTGNRRKKFRMNLPHKNNLFLVSVYLCLSYHNEQLLSINAVLTVTKSTELVRYTL